MRSPIRPLLLCTLLLALACSHPRGSGQAAPRSNSEVLTLDEMRGSGNFSNVYDMLAQLRFRWLQARGTDTINQKPGDVVVRLDDNEYGTVQSLRNLSPVGITSIRFVDPVSAAGRWGMGYAHGAILISTKPLRT
jgi:hypothetical protein